MSEQKLTPYMVSLKNQMIDKFIEQFNQSERLEVGSIVSSITPLDEEYFLPCDGRILDASNQNYKYLYDAIGDTYNNETPTRVYEGYFKIPKIDGKVIRMIDTEGILDDANRPLGDEKEWGLPEKDKLNFDLNNQDRFIRNKQGYKEADNADGQDTIPLHIVGAGASSNFQSKGFKYVSNGGGTPRIGDKVEFNRMVVYSYIYYKPLFI